ncbi:MAG TPA: hypothetical protein PKN96_09890 [Flavobacterium sp.]|uniref:hypothetical protein n=1 Tax=Flavobacterium sp. TaxID=239 RepID=UPI002C381DF2|nr:hypothetical protein [Flavobacterium sp.]HNP33592.1 hypothetical protein [Flavobacterium sp.]
MTPLKSILILLVFNITFGQAKKDNSNIVTTEPKSTNTRIPKNWKKLETIQKEWIKVEQDENGYLIYDPCDGATPTIKFDNGFIVLNSGLESEKFSYEKFTRLTGNNAFRLNAYNKESKTWFEIKARIIDNKKGIVLWEFSGVKWLMTPMEKKDNFRQIKNNCPKGKRKELKFLPVKETVD